jgi:hypothetical protein
MFSNLNYLTKNSSDEKNNEDNKKDLSGTTPALNQGNKFKKYQKKIKSNLEEIKFFEQTRLIKENMFIPLNNQRPTIF